MANSISVCVGDRLMIACSGGTPVSVTTGAALVVEPDVDASLQAALVSRIAASAAMEVNRFIGSSVSPEAVPPVREDKLGSDGFPRREPPLPRG